MKLAKKHLRENGLRALAVAAGLAIVLGLFATQAFSAPITVNPASIAAGTAENPAVVQWDTSAVTNEGMIEYKKIQNTISSGLITDVNVQANTVASVAGATKVQLLDSIGTVISEGCSGVGSGVKSVTPDVVPEAVTDVVTVKVISLITC